jgi:hypothetical protein
MVKSVLKSATVAIMVALSFGGCFGASAPKCDSDEAKQLVNQIAKDYYLPIFSMTNPVVANKVARMTLGNITTDNVDKELKITKCSGDTMVDGESYLKRLKYKLSVTSDGKLYAEVNLK